METQTTNYLATQSDGGRLYVNYQGELCHISKDFCVDIQGLCFVAMMGLVYYYKGKETDYYGNFYHN
jgi:hypothetical protein